MAFIGSFTVHINISLWTFQPVTLNTPAKPSLMNNQAVFFIVRLERSH